MRTFSRTGPTPANAHRHSRRGTAMIVAIICLVMVTAICFSLVRYALAANQQAERQGWRLQSVWLAESALAEVVHRLRADPDLTGEYWTIDDIGPRNDSGQIEVTVTPLDNDDRQRTISVIADFPADEIDRVRTQQSLTITLPDDVPADSN